MSLVTAVSLLLVSLCMHIALGDPELERNNAIINSSDVMATNQHGFVFESQNRYSQNQDFEVINQSGWRAVSYTHLTLPTKA